MAEAQGTAPEGLVAEPVVVRTETRWLFIMAGMLGIMLAVLVLTGVFQALHPLSHIEIVDPATLHLTGEFVESNLGAAIEPDGVVTVRMIAHQYMFTPECVTVPVGTLVRFRLTSPDVTHGFIIADTNANAMIVPGFVSEITTRFDQIGEYKMPCHEFCGFGHHGMWARVVVVPQDHFPKLGPDERMTCVPR